MGFEHEDTIPELLRPILADGPAPELREAAKEKQKQPEMDLRTRLETYPDEDLKRLGQITEDRGVGNHDGRWGRSRRVDFLVSVNADPGWLAGSDDSNLNDAARDATLDDQSLLTPPPPPPSE
jgi:hypothetical protein